MVLIRSKCNGYKNCKRKPIIGDRCGLHLPIEHPNALSSDKFDDILVNEIEAVKENDKGIYALNWSGFQFPEDHILFGSVEYEKVREKLD